MWDKPWRLVGGRLDSELCTDSYNYSGRVIPWKEEKVNDRIELLQEFQLVGVRFPSNDKVYHYKAPQDLVFEQGTMVLAPVEKNEEIWFKEVEIVELDAKPKIGKSFIYRWLLGDWTYQEWKDNLVKEKKQIALLEILEQDREREKLKAELQEQLGAENVLQLEAKLNA